MTKRSMGLLAVLLCVVFATCTGCATYVQTPGGWEIAVAAGQSKAHVKETPAMRLCQVVPEPAGVPAVAVYSSAADSYALQRPTQLQCNLVDGGREIRLEGGPISRLLAWLAAVVFSNGLVSALP